jgi:hypothetical protein
MKKHNEYALKGLIALQRAAYKVFEKAHKNNHKIPFWKNGHVVYEVPEIKTEQINSGDAKKRRT